MIVLSDGVSMLLSQRVLLRSSRRLMTHVTKVWSALTAHVSRSLAVVLTADRRIVKWTAFNQCLLALRFVGYLQFSFCYFLQHCIAKNAV